jgi:hypothetical protein
VEVFSIAGVQPTVIIFLLLVLVIVSLALWG